jgi:DNA-binding transcriptional LysR family regulator
MLDLRQLKYFVAVAEELHFGRAAASLHISQPPLSLKIRALEDELGLVLFKRTSRHVELTPAGKILLQQARELMVDADRFVKLAASLNSGVAGSLSVGYTAVMTYGLLPNVVLAFKERFPLVSLTLHEMVSSEQVRALQEHRLDVGMMRPSVPAGFKTIPLGEEEMLVFLPENHPLAAQEAITLSALASEPMIMFSKNESGYLHHLVMEMCAAAGFVPVVGQETRHIHAIVALVGIGLGLALLPESATHIHMKGVQVRPIRPIAGQLQQKKASFLLAVLDENVNPAAGHFMQVAYNLPARAA